MALDDMKMQRRAQGLRPYDDRPKLSRVRLPLCKIMFITTTWLLHPSTPPMSLPGPSRRPQQVTPTLSDLNGHTPWPADYRYNGIPDITNPNVVRSGIIPVPWFTHVSSPPYNNIKLDIDIDVPAFGIVFMNPPEEAIHYAAQQDTHPVYKMMLNGDLVVKLPLGCAAIRYESIRIGFRAECRLYKDVKAKPEITTLYEVTKDIPGGVITGEQRYKPLSLLFAQYPFS
jgi:hypothetical protein